MEHGMEQGRDGPGTAIMQPSNPKFCHPYDPYDIQLEFMSSLYDCIESGRVGIFESPTGTGKSLSLICGALTWLRDHKRRIFDDALQGPEENHGDWLAQAERAARRQELLRDRDELERKLASIRQAEATRKRQQDGERVPKKLRPTSTKDSKQLRSDEEFMLEDYDSDKTETTYKADNSNGLSTSTQALLEKLKGPATATDEQIQVDEIKVIFCSRTHSQLTQFINELRRVQLPSSISLEERHSRLDSEASETVKHLPLGSRKNLCINTKVAQLSSTTAVNERCLELQKSGTAQEHRCQYLPSKDNQDALHSFCDHSIASIRDIEDVANLGREMGICPYYASRAAIRPSEVLTLPYPLLLQKSARETLGVCVKDNIVVIDEAHNLMDAIADTFSVSIQLSHLRVATQQLTAYAQRFKTRLKGKNRVYITQVIRLVNSITDGLGNLHFTNQQKDTIITAAQLMIGKGVDQIKPHTLLQYLRDSKLAHKVDGYSESQRSTDGKPHPRGILMQFQNFLVVLMNPAAEGRFFGSQQSDDVVVRYTLLDPREHFRDIVQQARAVILAGGTMSPTSDYVNYLFSYLQPAQIRTFSFGHVIPKENILVEAVVQGPSGVAFDFTFEKRGSESMIRELGWLMVRICQSVPDGVVVFFPSYDYLSQVISVWKIVTKSASIMTKLGKQKRLFEESRAVVVDDLLREYAQAIDTGEGGLMLAVVGGKLSEGINFSDRLGRAVVAVGLPFPNANSAEWKAKMEHVEAVRYNQGKDQEKLSDGEARGKAKAAGRELYENACMRAVNQSIGRAIRHKNDYAAILLVDRRFATDRIRDKLPGWIRGSMRALQGSGEWKTTETSLKNFFEGRLEA